MAVLTTAEYIFNLSYLLVYTEDDIIYNDFQYYELSGLTVNIIKFFLIAETLSSLSLVQLLFSAVGGSWSLNLLKTDRI